MKSWIARLEHEEKNTVSYMGHTGELPTELGGKLSKGPMERFDRFHAGAINVCCMKLEAHFEYGFSLGFMMIRGIYDTLNNNQTY